MWRSLALLAAVASAADSETPTEGSSCAVVEWKLETDLTPYGDFAATMESYGYDWEPYTVQTSDGWLLTLFHVLGRYGERPSQDESNIDKPPVHIQHGAQDSG